MKIMEENEAYKPLPLEITFNQTEDLLELSQNKKYKKFILEETYRALKTNIPLKSEKIQLFDKAPIFILIGMKDITCD